MIWPKDLVISLVLSKLRLQDCAKNVMSERHMIVSIRSLLAQRIRIKTSVRIWRNRSLR